MQLHFTKMEGLGNDYVYVNCFKEQVTNPTTLSRRISDRHFGIGADGLILIKPSDMADFAMEMYNADGSQGAMCGNGIRCVGKYVYDYGLTDKTKLRIETGSGIRDLILSISQGKVSDVTVQMGEPRLLFDLPVSLMVKDTMYDCTCVSMGNLHCVLFVPEVDVIRLHELGPYFEHHSRFPERVNTEFVQVIDRTHIKMRVWERGSGETLACGTGACAAAVACALADKTDNEVDVLLPGGMLFTRWDRADNEMYMTGPANTIFDGIIEI